MKAPSTIATIGISLGIGTITLIAITFYTKNKSKNNNKSKPNENWQKFGILKEINLYPIKSSSAVSVQNAECDEFGLISLDIHDRRLLVIHETDDKIASVGRYPQMLSIKAKISSNGVLSLSAPNEAPIEVDINGLQTGNRSERVKKMKGYSLNLTECLPAHHNWVSRALLKAETGMRLYLADTPKQETSCWRSIKNDLIPVMVMHNKSVEELNTKIGAESAIHHLQFRGNLLVQSADDVPAFDEDKWMWLKIGDDAGTCTILRYDSPCLRCIIPNINIFTCERSADFEPLKALRSFRLRSHPKDPEMGVYFKVFKTGIVQTGDEVYVQYK